MSSRAAVTVNLPTDEVKRLWETPGYVSDRLQETTVQFKGAPGDRGTEIHADLGGEGFLKRLTGGDLPAKVKDDLRRFKQRAETGEIPRSDGTPEGELVERKFKQRPAQPLEREKAGV
jgi:hypothetical protein